MSVYKRGGVWWYEFWFTNVRIRESTKASSKTLAKEAEKNRRRELEKGYNGISSEDRSKRVQTLSQAADQLLADYALKNSANSLRYLKQRIVHIKAHMGDMMLIEIGDTAISGYQTARLQAGASGSSINAEVMFILHMMGEIGDAVRLKLRREKRLRLAKNENCGKALTLEQEAALLSAAQVPEVPEGKKMNLKATRSPAIYPAIMLALNTTMRESEVRTLRWGQIDFLKRILTVGKSKTNAGTGRTIPINSELFRVLAEYRAWYEEKVSAVAPDIYVFPFGDCRKYEPKRPISSLKTSWTNVRNKAGLSLRFHDLRHTAITKLAESGAGDETIMAIAGHVSRGMLSRYAHIRTEAKRQALDAIATKPAGIAANVSVKAAVS
jgi:integrase